MDSIILRLDCPNGIPLGGDDLIAYVISGIVPVLLPSEHSDDELSDKSRKRFGLTMRLDRL